MSSEKQVNLSIEEFKLKAENSNHPVFKQILEESSKIPLLCSKLRDAMYKTKKRRN
jgi:hypothetical protein